jgi:hypothetical protein
MKRLLTTLVILTGLLGSGGAVWAQDLSKGHHAYKSGDFATALKERKPPAPRFNSRSPLCSGHSNDLSKGRTAEALHGRSQNTKNPI